MHIKTIMRYCLVPSRMVPIKKKKKKEKKKKNKKKKKNNPERNVGKGVEKWALVRTADRNIKCCNPVEKDMATFQKTKNKFTI